MTMCLCITQWSMYNTIFRMNVDFFWAKSNPTPTPHPSITYRRANVLAPIYLQRMFVHRSLAVVPYPQRPRVWWMIAACLPLDSDKEYVSNFLL